MLFLKLKFTFILKLSTDGGGTVSCLAKVPLYLLAPEIFLCYYYYYYLLKVHPKYFHSFTVSTLFQSHFHLYIFSLFPFLKIIVSKAIFAALSIF